MRPNIIFVLLDGARWDRLDKSVKFLPEILQKNGYFTSCNLISDKVISSRGFNIHQSHDEYVDDLFSIHPDYHY